LNREERKEEGDSLVKRRGMKKQREESPCGGCNPVINNEIINIKLCCNLFPKWSVIGERLGTGRAGGGVRTSPIIVRKCLRVLAYSDVTLM